MSKKSRERRERQQQRIMEVQRARAARSGTFWDDILLNWEISKDHPLNRMPIIDISMLRDLVLDKLELFKSQYIEYGEDVADEVLGDSVRNDVEYPFMLFGISEESPLKPPFDECIVSFPSFTGDRKKGAVISWTNRMHKGYCMIDIQLIDAEKEFYGKAETSYVRENGSGIYPGNCALDWNIDDDVVTYEFLMSTIWLNFLNCRNIELVDHAPDAAASREYERHFGRPLTTYKTLRIKPTGKRYGDGGELKPYQGIMPLHIRRGNFATYTDDAPLFGKYTGTFWRPATAVGERENGIAVKDYEVEARGTA